MVKLFTQNTFTSDWSDDRKENQKEDSVVESTLFSPSEESVAFLKSFARSFMVDLSRDPHYVVPMA